MESMVKDLITNYIKMQDELQLKEAESKSLQEITKKMEEENRK